MSKLSTQSSSGISTATGSSAQTGENIRTRVLSAVESTTETECSVADRTLRALYEEHPWVTLEDVLELKVLVTVSDDPPVEECVDRTLALADEILDL
ncbi:hypothetical protein [Halorussus sp. AFM4]|uniref:hypothetical protein n=1 Tax=Halorussus sp. AFM4 TaxID=3421651 RepID=UPI003EBB6988